MESSNFNSVNANVSKDNVKVVIRVRPLNDRERNNGGFKKCITIDNESSIAIEGYKAFNFDYIADEEVPQNIIFEQIAKPIADSCLEGYNGSIFAYGQTGSGKTFTIQGPSQIGINGEETIFSSRMKGSSGRFNIEAENQRGLMQRSFEYIFECLDTDRIIAENDSYHFEYLIRCSYLEIYNEQILDLLEPTSINLHIREDIKKGVYVEGLQEEVVLSADDMIKLIQTGAKNRHVGSHAMNKESSRSHSVLTTIIETKSMKDSGVWNIKTSRFHIIDLAGSERSKQTNAVGERLKEAGMINKSLSALGNVINSLVDISEGKSRHVHYRDSKLTFLLRDSLGGNSKTLIIANVSPSSSCHGETLSTLKFAQRAKLIRNKAVINEDSSGTIQLLKAEISRLKKDLAESEKLMKLNGVECARCKLMFEAERNEEGRDDDEMLLSFDQDDQCLESSRLTERSLQKRKAKSEIIVLRQRVTHLEGLLSANLDSLSGQQRYYENEVQKLQSQLKKMQSTVESYEKQSARDKMIIKFREERISKLEQGNHMAGSGEEERVIGELRKEIALWKEAADHNTQAAKLFAEKSDLQNKLESLKIEAKMAPESLSVQIKSLTEFNESLNQYLKSYCEESKKELERELLQVKSDCAVQLDSLTSHLADLSDQLKTAQKHILDKDQAIDILRQEVISQQNQFAQEKHDLLKLNSDALAQLKSQVLLSNDESERAISLLRVDLVQKDSVIESERERCRLLERDLASRIADIAKLDNQIILQNEKNEKQTEKMKFLIAQIEEERRQNKQAMDLAVESWENKVKDMETHIEDIMNEKEVIADQCEQVSDECQRLRQEIEANGQKVIEREEDNLQIQQDLEQTQISLNEAHQTICRLETQVSQLRAKFKLSEIQSQQSLSETTQQLSEAHQQLSSQQAQLSQTLDEYNSLQTKLSEASDSLSAIKQTNSDLLLQLNHSKQQQQETHSELIKTLQALADLRQQSRIDLEHAQNSFRERFEQTRLEKEKELEIMLEESVARVEEERAEARKAKIEAEEAHRKEVRQVLEQMDSKIKRVQEESQVKLAGVERELEQEKENTRQLIMKIDIDRLDEQELRREDERKRQEEEKRKDKVREDMEKQYQENIEVLEREIQQIKGERDRIIDFEVHDRIISEKEQKIIHLTATIAEIRISFAQQIDAIKLHNIELQTQLQQKQGDLQQHNQHLSNLSSALSDSQNKLLVYHQETNRLALQLDQQLQQNDLLLRELEIKDQELSQQHQSQSDLQLQKDNQISILQSEKSALLTELANVKLQTPPKPILYTVPIQTDSYLDKELQVLTAQLADKEIQINDLTGQISKLKKRMQEQEDMLVGCKNTISMLRQKETDIEQEIKTKYQEFQVREEKLKKHISEGREERDKQRREIDGLKELVKMKDKQLEDYVNSDERDRAALERISKENRDMRGQMTKREFEMKDMAKTLKFYLEENTRLKKDNEKLHKENDQLIGHKNPSQKIQHHVRIKEENNRLREENLKLQDELRRKIDVIAKGRYQPECFSPSDQDVDPTQIQNHSSNYFEQAALKLIDILFTQPNLIKTLPEILDPLPQSTVDKAKRAMEFITHLNDYFQQRETKLRDLEREVKSFESILAIAEKERILSQNQQREMIQSPSLQGLPKSHHMRPPTASSSQQNILNKENLASIHILAAQQRLKVAQTINSNGGLQPRQERENSASGTAATVILPRKELTGHQVLRAGSAKRMVSGAAAAFINVGPGATSQQTSTQSQSQLQNIEQNQQLL